MKWIPFGSDWVADLVMFGYLRIIGFIIEYPVPHA